MKKIVAIMVLAIFILSVVPMALAAEGDDTDVAKDKMDLKKDADKKELRVKKDAKKLDIKEKKDMIKQKRENFKRNVKELREGVHKARERYKDAREQFSKHKDNLANLRKKVKDCGDDCDDRKKELRKGGFKHLAKSADVMLNSLERLKEHLSKKDGNDALIAEVADFQEEIATQKDALLAAAEAGATKDELRDGLKSLRETWKKAKSLQKKGVKNSIDAKLDVVVKKHQKYLENMEAKVAKVKEAGKDTAKLEEFVTQFKEHTSSVEAKNAELKDATGDEWKTAWKELRDDLKKSKDILRDFMKEFRVGDGDDSDDDKDEAESENPEEETTDEE